MLNVNRLSPEDALSFKSVSDAQVSPDGGLVAFVVGDPYTVDTKLPRSNVWVVPTAGGEVRQFTYGPRSDTAPRWSPDGRTLAFLSDRVEDGQRQVYVLPRSGGEGLQLTRIKGKISAPRSLDPMAWSPDGLRIAFLVTDPETEDEKKRKESKNDHVEFELHPKYTRLYTVHVESREVVCVSPDELQVWEFCWSPDGTEIAAVASDLPFEQAWYSNRLVAFPSNGGAARTLHQAKRQVAKPTWSPDGDRVAFLSSIWSDRGITAGGVFVVPAKGGEARELSIGHVASVNSLAWSGDSVRLMTVAQERGQMGVAELDAATGERISLWRGNITISDASTSFSTDREGNIALVRQEETGPPDVWLAKRVANGIKWSQLTRLHPRAAEFEIGAVETLHWKGSDDWEIQGLLIRPAGADAGPMPMVTVVHGGPTGMNTYRYFPAFRYYGLLAANGLAVFIPNFRGSTGWGLEFAESNIGDMGGKDWGDILAGIDYCVKQGIADPQRLGICGGSYGGFMTAWAVTQTDRFKAGVMIAGIADWRSFHGKSYLCDWDSIHYGDADPYDPDGPYRKYSPITYVKRVKTPTLILHGEADEDVPVEQSYLFHRALKDLGVKTELVVYPREHHGFVERNHIIDMNRRTVLWLAEHLEP